MFQRNWTGLGRPVGQSGGGAEAKPPAANFDDGTGEKVPTGRNSGSKKGVIAPSQRQAAAVARAKGVPLQEPRRRACSVSSAAGAPSPAL
eukprot:COSAG01_NODE_4118_length_5335_cov_3.316272_7_plen_90_part_00